MEIKKQSQFLSENNLDELAINYSEKSKEYIKKQRKWLIFSIEQKLFTLSMKEIDEIAMVDCGIAPPMLNHYVLGLINIRANPVILVDMGQILGLRTRVVKQDQQRVLLIRNQQRQSAAFLVDAITGVTSLSKWNKQQPKKNPHYHSDFVDARTKHKNTNVSRLIAKKLLDEIHL